MTTGEITEDPAPLPSLLLLLDEEIITEKMRNVDPACAYASNPYHRCTEHCAERAAEERRRTKGGKSVQNKERSKEVGRVVGEGRNVDPMCVNASNPYHRCTKYCSQRTPEARKRINGEKSVENWGEEEGRMSGERRNVDPICVSASNPDHHCTEHCSQRTPEARRQTEEGKSDQNGERCKEEGSVVGERRNVDPMCVNASNPYHRCTEYCSQRTPEARKRTGGPKPVQNVESRKEEGRVMGKGRNVDPMCVNASNPYHRCTEYCSQRTPEAKRRTEGGKSVTTESMEGVKMGENRKVDPRCVNASNPYHKCTEHCFQRSPEMGRIKGGKSEESRGVVKVERRNGNPKCANASNPYHKCTEHCSQRIHEAM